MKFEEFKSGEYRQQYQYKGFLPEKINHEWTWGDPRVNVMLEKATKTLGELNAFTLIVPDVDLFIRMHVIKEANTSSRIEGTRTEMDEVVLDEQEVIPERRDDWGEVQNYVRAMNTAVDDLKRLPLSVRLLRNSHSILMSGVRGEKKTPGEFRRSQNWIGALLCRMPLIFRPITRICRNCSRIWKHSGTMSTSRCPISSALPSVIISSKRSTRFWTATAESVVF